MVHLNNSLVPFLLETLLGATLFGSTAGVCRQCGDLSGVACLTANTFVACFNGSVSNKSLTCPGDMVCANTASICVNASTSNHQPACPYCGVCNTAMTFACLNSTAFAYCFGTTTPSVTDIDVCPTNSFCSVTATAPNFCTSDAQSSTCLENSAVSTTTTTTIAPTTSTGMPTIPTAQSICAAQGAVGNYPDPSDTTCQMFAYCFYYAGAMRSQFYMCPGRTVFDPAMQLCVLPSNYNCTVAAKN